MVEYNLRLTFNKLELENSPHSPALHEGNNFLWNFPFVNGPQTFNNLEF